MKQGDIDNTGYSTYNKADFRHNQLVGGGDIAEGRVNFTSNQNYSVDADGIHTASLQVQGEYYVVLNHITDMGVHPNHAYMLKTNFGAQRISGNLGLGTVTFKGCPTSHEYINWSVQASGYQKPIDMHPFFGAGKEIAKGKTEFSGNSSAYGYRFGGNIQSTPQGSNQAKLISEMGSTRFSHFPRESSFDLPGITSYLEPTLVLKFSLVTHASLGNKTNFTNNAKKGGYIYEVGKIFKESELPNEISLNVGEYMAHDDDRDNYNWLCTGARAQIFGMALRQEVELTLSGRLGHNTLVYKDREITGQSFSNNMIE